MTREPRRTCVACRQVRGKRELVRLVRRQEGTVVVDERGQAPGRGGPTVMRGGEKGWRRPGRGGAGRSSGRKGTIRGSGFRVAGDTGGGGVTKGFGVGGT